jgi:hypothetical protein
MKHEKVSIINDTTEYSGSIQEIKYISSSNAPIIEFVTFGTYVDGGDNTDHQRYAADITLTPNETLEGPITSFKLAQGVVSVKYNRDLKTA